MATDSSHGRVGDSTGLCGQGWASCHSTVPFVRSIRKASTSSCRPVVMSMTGGRIGGVRYGGLGMRSE